MSQFDVDIESLNSSGDGVARVGGQPVTVPLTIPGERVRIRLPPPMKARGPARQDPPYASLVEVLRPSPHRVAAPCPHFGPCGGCSWQHIAYPEQLRLKTELVSDLVRAAVPGAPNARPTLPSTPIDNPWGYRHKVHFVFDDTEVRGKGPHPLVMGHYIRGSRRVLQVRECPVHAPRGNGVAFEFNAAFRKARVEGDRGGLRGLAVRVGAGTDEVMTTLIVSKDADRRTREATRAAQARQPSSSSLHVNMHTRRDGYIFGRDTKRIAGPERMREVVGGASFLVSPTAFFQTNIAAAEILVALVAAEVPPTARVLDLYAGAGLFAIPLAMAGHQVVAVEENRQAVADGEASARLNRIGPERCRFLARSAAAYTEQPTSFDVVILDPPREGSEPPVLEHVFRRLRPARAIYISCNPEALARDLALIVADGYRIQSMQPVDMFPHTAHIETVVVLARQKPVG